MVVNHQPGTFWRYVSFCDIPYHIVINDSVENLLFAVAVFTSLLYYNLAGWGSCLAAPGEP